MKDKYKYMIHIRWSEDDKAYIAEVPELPGCATHGSTYEATMKHAKHAIESWINGAKEAGYPIPEPLALRKFSGKFITRVDPKLHQELSLKAKASGKTLNRFVRELLEEGVEENTNKDGP